MVAELPIEVAEELANVTKALTDRLAALAIELNDKAVKAAERRVAAVIRTAGEQREQAERELADATLTVEDLESKLDEANAEGVSQRQELAHARAANQTLSVELAQLRERLAFMEQNAKAAAQAHAAELAEQKKAAEQAAAERDQLRGELATVKAKADAADQAHHEQRKTAAQETHRLAERMTKIETERDTARKEASSAREDAAKLRGQVESLQAQAAELLRTLRPADPKK